MTKLPSPTTISISAADGFILSVVVAFLSVVFSLLYSTADALGSGSTIAVSYGSGTVCAIVAAQPTQRILCYRRGAVVPVVPDTSFSEIAGGRSSLCGIRSGGYSLLCWDLNFTQNPSFVPKRIYVNYTVSLGNLSVGDEQVCATTADGVVKCWRGNDNVPVEQNFGSISSGVGFTCGILKNTSRVHCWGRNNSIAKSIETEFGDRSMLSISAGGSHVCGVDSGGFLFCHGNNESGQLNPPSNSSSEFSALALGSVHSCAIRVQNGSVVCWGGGGEYSVNVTESFDSIVSGWNFTCGLTTRNFSIICWGPGWENGSGSLVNIPALILPGPCVQSSCSECGIYTQPDRLCFNSGKTICKHCLPPILLPPPPPPSVPVSPPPPPPPSDRPRSSPPSKELTRGLLAFAIVGSVGTFAGLCTVIYCLWTGVCFGNKKIHNSVQPTITRAGSNGGVTTSNNSPPSRSSTIRRQGSRVLTIRRQRSGTSSKHTDRAEEFSLAELAAATNDFSLENKIGSGSFGVVYRGKLWDGREVAIKRGETGQKKLKKLQEKESAYDSELAFLSRLHHKHLVRLVGFCEEGDERLLVYEYMKYGALYDHLHDKNNVEKTSSLLNSWKMRIKIALDASRGIEYLHNYAVPPIIHRDIKSSNILLDVNWTARVSDFGLSLMGSDSECENRENQPIKAAGTVGYIDPEYYGLNVLTVKSDVYGLGVVLLELLTGKKAIFKDGEGEGNTPISIVDYAVPAIMAGELVKVMDPRVGPPALNEAEAVELVAYTAMHCVNLEGKERPIIGDIVSNLERALTLCVDDESHGSISSGSISIVSAD